MPLLLLLTCLSTWAQLSLSLERPTSGITETVTYTKANNGDWLVKRSTNRFWKGDRRLGTFTIAANPKSKEVEAKLIKIETDINETAKLIPPSLQAQVLASTAGKSLHQKLVTFNGKRYPFDSSFFNELYQIVADFSQLPMEFKEGVAITDNYQALVRWQDGKAGEALPYDDIGNCPSLEGKRLCQIPEWGILRFP